MLINLKKEDVSMKKLLATLLSLTLAATLVSTSLVDSIKSPIIDSEILAQAYDEEQSDIDSDSSETHEHSYQEVISKNATCTEDGIKTFICNCGYSYEETIPATGHNYAVSIVKPTYANTGYTLHECSNCGDEYRDSYIPKLVLSNIKGLKATTTSSSIKLIWNKVKDANGYVIYQNSKKIKTTSGTSYTVSKLKAGTSYKFYVKPYVKSNSKTVYGTQSNVLTTSTNPAKVSFKLTSDTKSATIKWSKVTGATGYKVYYKTSSKGKWKLLKTASNKTVSCKKSGLTPGKTYWFTVKAYRNANGKTYSGTYATKSVKIKEIKAKSVKLNKSKISIQRGNSYRLKATINPKNTTDKITWTSSNKKVATVSSKGVVKGIKKGTVTITAKINGKKATCKVTITKRKTKSIKLSKSKAIIISGKTFKLSRTINPSNSDEGVVWSSSNSSVASIKIQGQTCIITGKKKGTAIITAKSGSKKATCKVTVVGNETRIGQTLYNDRNCQIIYQGYEFDNSSFGHFAIKVHIINKTNKTICVQTRNESVNNLMTDFIFSPEIAPYKSAKEKIILKDYQMAEDGINRNNIRWLDFNFHYFDWDDWFDDVDTHNIHISF